MSPLTKQIFATAAGAAVAATVTALVTHWLTKDSTIAGVASGAIPLPAGATPQTSKPMSTGPGTTTPGGTAPTPTLPAPTAGAQTAMTISQAANVLQGYMGPTWTDYKGS